MTIVAIHGSSINDGRHVRRADEYGINVIRIRQICNVRYALIVQCTHEHVKQLVHSLVHKGNTTIDVVRFVEFISMFEQSANFGRVQR